MNMQSRAVRGREPRSTGFDGPRTARVLMMRPWALPVSLVLCGAAVAASPFRAGEPVPGAAVLLAFLLLAAVASPAGPPAVARPCAGPAPQRGRRPADRLLAARLRVLPAAGRPAGP
ncbi:hypothetical protein GCM10010238_32480 [Streptomyces griseoviridis]|uniref:Uncharacterized protein n=1 Tax=Streptomyces griseoviridis TaxID=45398 RepID=A0A918LFM8_STRGD|nr:hypothetical protein GCM10010238_32480 [Streptomyces niveoruber]